MYFGICLEGNRLYFIHIYSTSQNLTSSWDDFKGKYWTVRDHFSGHGAILTKYCVTFKDRVVSSRQFGDAEGIRPQLSRSDLQMSWQLMLLHSGLISRFLFFSFSVFSLPQSISLQEVCLSEAGCFKPQRCSPAAASGLSSHSPSISGSAECGWRNRQKAGSAAAHWLRPL